MTPEALPSPPTAAPKKPEPAEDYPQWAARHLERAADAEGWKHNDDGSARDLGVIPAEAMRALQRRGLAPKTPAITMRAKDLQHLARDFKRDNKKKIALSEADILRLPEIVARPMAVLRETREGGCLVVVFRPADPAETRLGKLLARPDRSVAIREGARKARHITNVVSTGGLASAESFGNRGLYELLQGKIVAASGHDGGEA